MRVTGNTEIDSTIVSDCSSLVSDHGFERNGHFEVIAYKLVAKVDDCYFSIFAGSRVEYRLDQRLEEEACPNNGGGFYVCRSPTVAMRVPRPKWFGHLAILRCACSGPFVIYPGSKITCSRLKPLSEVPLPKIVSKRSTVRRPRGAPMPEGIRSWHALSREHAETRRHVQSSGPGYGRPVSERRVRSPATSTPQRPWSVPPLPGYEHGHVAQRTGGPCTIGYKLVATDGRKYFSLYNSKIEYSLGVPVEDMARPDRQGGLYFCYTPLEAAKIRVTSASATANTMPQVLLRCLCEGPFIEYPGGKIACSRLTPVEQVVGIKTLHKQQARCIYSGLTKEYPRAPWLALCRCVRE